MKKSIKLLFLFLIIFALMACSITQSTVVPTEQPTIEETQPQEQQPSTISPTLTEFAPSQTPEPSTSEPISANTPAVIATNTQASITSTPASSASESPFPQGALTLITLGDSLTEGEGDDSGTGGFPPRVLEKINTIRPDSTLVNLGHSGWSSNDLIQGLNSEPSQLKQAVEEIDKATTNHKPVIVTVWIGSNDLWYLYEYGPEPMTSDAENQDLDNYSKNINTILEKISKPGVKVFIALLDDQSKRPVVANPPNPNEPAFPNISKDDLKLMSTHIAEYNKIIQAAAQTYKAISVDFYNTDIFTNPTTLYDDGNHPNSAGYDVITGIWFNSIQSILK